VYKRQDLLPRFPGAARYIAPNAELQAKSEPYRGEPKIADVTMIGRTSPIGLGDMSALRPTPDIARPTLWVKREQWLTRSFRCHLASIQRRYWYRTLAFRFRVTQNANPQNARHEHAYPLRTGAIVV
ncbi:MAG: hypothetical protein ACSLE4_05310, partial [Methyloceanibacter sp.]|uniref:hypothetical protein n=1 Tax=Methyloceanibacter sp. TaxID=1965321 RepID=UPI003EDFD4C4